jgi:hypothetical protein
MQINTEIYNQINANYRGRSKGLCAPDDYNTESGAQGHFDHSVQAN